MTAWKVAKETSPPATVGSPGAPSTRGLPVLLRRRCRLATGVFLGRIALSRRSEVFCGIVESGDVESSCDTQSQFERPMPDHIVMVLRAERSPAEAREALKALPAWAMVEPQFTGLAARRPDEHRTISQMRRTMRVRCPVGVDIDELIRALNADPLVESVYREPPAEPA